MTRPTAMAPDASTSPLDWSRPIEAVHEDGRVVDVQFINYDGRHNNRGQPDKSGDYYTTDPERERHRDGIWLSTGEAWSSSRVGWRIRNVQPTTSERDPVLWNRMEAFVRRWADETITNLLQSSQVKAEAKAIVADLPKPVDPDNNATKQLLDDMGWALGSQPLDDVQPLAIFNTVKAAIKRGRELAGEQA